MSTDGILSIKSILEGCIERERMSIRTYEKALKIVQGEKGQKLLTALRKDEIRHEKKLSETLQTGRLDDLGAVERQPQKPVLSTKSVGTLDQNSTPRQILAFAIHHEEMAVQYFSRYVDAFRGTELGELFELLRGEEQNHRDRLTALLERLSK